MDIVVYPDPVLNQPSRLITDEELKAGFAGDVSLNNLIEEMTSIMRQYRGAGISAVQVGVNLRLFLFDIPAASPIVFINPELSDFGSSVELPEGCLSFPGIKLSIRRPATVKVTAKNLQGTMFEILADGLKARVIQHEFDHLNGRSFITRANINLDRRNIRLLDQMEHSYASWQKRLLKRAQKTKGDTNAI